MSSLIDCDWLSELGGFEKRAVVSCLAELSELVAFRGV